MPTSFVPALLPARTQSMGFSPAFLPGGLIELGRRVRALFSGRPPEPLAIPKESAQRSVESAAQTRAPA